MSAGQWRLIMVGVVFGVVTCLVAGGQAAPAKAAEQFSLEKSFGPDGAEGSGFVAAGGTAVDQDADVAYVLDQGGGTISKFDLDGNPVNFGGSAPYISGNQITGLSVGGGSGERQIAANSTSGVIYITSDNGTAVQAFQENGEPALFASGPGAGTNKIGGFTSLFGVAVDANGSIYASDWGSVGNGELFIYAASGAPITSVQFTPGFGQANIAVATDGALYVNVLRSKVFKFIPSAFPVTSETTYTQESNSINAAKSYTVGIDPASDDVYIAEDEPARIRVYKETGELRATFGEGELERPRGVAIDGGAERIVVSTFPESGLSQAKIYQRERILDAPTIEASTADEVSINSAVLRARINPNSLETVYQFEYGLEECEGAACTAVPLDMTEIGSGHEGVVVTELLAGLASGTTYFFRVVAENELGVTIGTESSFTTQGTGLSFGLEDSRVWELVSPAQKAGGIVVNSVYGAVQASANGDGLAYLSRGAIVDDPEGNRLPEVSSVLGERENGIWHSEDLSPPFSNATELQDNGEYNIFSPELTLAEMEPRDDTPLSPWASERTPYLRTIASPPVFRPLVTSIEPFANVPPGTQFGPLPQNGSPAVKIQAATQDLAHIVLQSRNAPLSSGAQPGSLYMWTDGLLEPVSELPQTEGGETVRAIPGSGPGSIRNAVSADGTRVFWAPSEGYTGAGITLSALYLRNLELNETSRLDLVQPGGSGAGEPLPAFQGASEEGDVVFFTDSQQLTEDASPDGRDLYRCEIEESEGSLGCADMTNVSAPLPGSGESANVLDQVTALSSDGGRLYFVATGVLDEQQNDAGDTAEPGQPNLYLWQDGEGVRFIAALSEEDHGTWGAGAERDIGFESQLTAIASPGGRYLAFASEKPLTGYENRNATGGLNAEVFLYDALDDRMQCISCNPTNAAAVGEKVPASAEAVDPGSLWGGRWAAGVLPEISLTEPVTTGGRSLYRSRSVLGNGRVFFNAADALVPADSNGNWDVYQFEPVGTGSCTSSSAGAAVVRSGDGCVSLLSSGTSSGDSGFLDASSSGNDVFFITRGRLSPWDEDDAMDVYDARVNGVEAVRPPIIECAGASCRSFIQQSEYTPPGSESFHGAGNQMHCPKGKRKVYRGGKPRCVKKNSKGKKHQKRAGKSRRANR